MRSHVSVCILLLVAFVLMLTAISSERWVTATCPGALVHNVTTAFTVWASPFHSCGPNSFAHSCVQPDSPTGYASTCNDTLMTFLPIVGALFMGVITVAGFRILFASCVSPQVDVRRALEVMYPFCKWMGVCTVFATCIAYTIWLYGCQKPIGLYWQQKAACAPAKATHTSYLFIIALGPLVAATLVQSDTSVFADCYV